MRRPLPVCLTADSAHFRDCGHGGAGLRGLRRLRAAAGHAPRGRRVRVSSRKRLAGLCLRMLREGPRGLCPFHLVGSGRNEWKATASSSPAKAASADHQALSNCDKFPVHHSIQSTNFAKFTLSCSYHVIGFFLYGLISFHGSLHASAARPSTVLPQLGCTLESHGDRFKIPNPEHAPDQLITIYAGGKRVKFGGSTPPPTPLRFQCTEKFGNPSL